MATYFTTYQTHCLSHSLSLLIRAVTVLRLLSTISPTRLELFESNRDTQLPVQVSDTKGIIEIIPLKPWVTAFAEI